MSLTSGILLTNFSKNYVTTKMLNDAFENYTLTNNFENLTPKNPSNIMITSNDDTKNEGTERAVLEHKINAQPVRVIDTGMLDKSNSYANKLYVTITNLTKKDIKNVSMLSYGWDIHDLPIRIDNTHLTKKQYGNAGTLYNANIVPGGSATSTTSIYNDVPEKVKSIIVRYETYDGEIWVNPYLNEWIKLFEGKKLSYSD